MEIVDLAIKHSDFPWQTVSLPESIGNPDVGIQIPS